MSDRSLFIPLSILAACLAGTISVFANYKIRDLFHRIGIVDRPNEARKQHKKPVAYGGGTALLLSMGAALAIVVGIVVVSQQGELSAIRPMLGLALGAGLIWCVGLIDDARNMRGTIKLLWQIVAAALVVVLSSGTQVQRVALFGTTVPLGYLGVPLGILWILAAVNSMNLLDGMDGLAGTVGLLLSVTIGLMAICTGRWVEATVAFALAGSLLGFLRLNWPPAQIYLGDSGSMLIGLILGALSIRCEVKDATSVAVAAPLAMFAIPLLDSFAAVVRRKLTGRSMYTTDRGHIHHRMLTQGLSNQQTLYVLGGLCSLTCLGGLLDVYLRNVAFPFGLVSVLLVVGILLSTRIFGNSELSLLGSRCIGLLRRLFPAATPRNNSVRLQGTLEWERVWQDLLSSCERFDLIHLRLNLQLPDLHEDFYASWRTRSLSRTDHRWTVELPLAHDQQVIGFLTIVAALPDDTVASSLFDFSDLVAQLEKELGQIVDRERAGKRETKGELQRELLGASE